MDKKVIARELVRMAKELIGKKAVNVKKIIDALDSMNSGGKLMDLVSAKSIADYFDKLSGGLLVEGSVREDLKDLYSEYMDAFDKLDDSDTKKTKELRYKYFSDCAEVIKKQIKNLARRKEGYFSTKEVYDAVQQLGEEI